MKQVLGRSMGMRVQSQLSALSKYRVVGTLVVSVLLALALIPAPARAQSSMICDVQFEIHAPPMISASPGEMVVITYAATLMTSYVQQADLAINIDLPSGPDASYAPRQQSWELDPDDGQRTQSVTGQIAVEIPNNVRGLESYAFSSNTALATCSGPAFPEGIQDGATGAAFNIQIRIEATATPPPPPPTATPPPPTATPTATPPPPPTPTPSPTPSPTATPISIPTPSPTAVIASLDQSNANTNRKLTATPSPPPSTATPTPSPSPTNEPTSSPAATADAEASSLRAQLDNATPVEGDQIVDVVESRYDTSPEPAEEDDGRSWLEIWVGLAGGLLVSAGAIAIWRARPTAS